MSINRIKGRSKGIAKQIVAGLALTLTVGTSSAFAEAGDWLIRSRALVVVPDESADISAIGGSVAIESDITPEIDVTYFFTDKLALEVIAATTRHDVVATGTALGDVDLGEIRLLPPTFTLQYHPLAGQKFSPYVGAGVNLTIFYDDKLPRNRGAVTDIKYDDSIGFLFQAGADFYLSDKMFLNLDVKKVFLGTDVELNGGAIEADVDIDPWIFGAGVGFKF